MVSRLFIYLDYFVKNCRSKTYGFMINVEGIFRLFVIIWDCLPADDESAGE